MAGNIFVISAPSGTGKTTVIRKLLATVRGLVLSVSYTTRRPRPQERDGVDYTFIERDRFRTMVASGGFIEWADVHGELYGTPKKDVEGYLSKGMDVLLDIDVQGAANVKQKYPDAVLIFLLPPSFEELEKRLRSRGESTEEDIKTRLNNAYKEWPRRHEYDYQVVNEDLGDAIDEIIDIISYYSG